MRDIGLRREANTFPNPRKPPSKAYSEPEADDEQVEVRVGFGASEGHPEGTKHKHEFGSIPCLVPYQKNGHYGKDYLVVFCSCGETKEILVANRMES